MEAVLDAKKQEAVQMSEENVTQKGNTIKSTIRRIEEPNIATQNAESSNPDSPLATIDSTDEVHSDDLDIYDSLFSETTIVSTQIYTYEIDRNLGEDNYSSSCSYRVGHDNSDIGTIFTITKNELETPLNISRPHSSSDIEWYNDLAGLGYSYAAVFGTTVQGIIICEPQLWNNILYVRHLMVTKKSRLNGIGKKLIEECVSRAQAEGFRAITLEVTSSNGAAIDFYRKMNFNIVGLNAGLYSNSDILKGDVGIFMNRIIV